MMKLVLNTKNQSINQSIINKVIQMIEYLKYMQNEQIQHQSFFSKLFDEIISGK